MNRPYSPRIWMAAIVLILIVGGVVFAYYYAVTSSRISELQQSASRADSFESSVSQLESQLTSLESREYSASTNQTLLLQSGITPSAPCFDNSLGVQSVSCSVRVNPPQAVLVMLQAVPPIAVHDSVNSSFLLLANETHQFTTYRFCLYFGQIWSANTGGTDTITASGVGNYLMVSALPLFGDAAIDNVSSSSGSSSTPAVAEFTPPKNAFVFAAMFAPDWSTVSAGRGYALVGQYAGIMADEYGTATGPVTATFQVTSGWHPDFVNASGSWSDFQQWTEISVALSCTGRCSAPSQSQFHP